MHFNIPLSIALCLTLITQQLRAQWEFKNTDNASFATCCFTYNPVGVLVAGGSNGTYWSTDYGDSWHHSVSGIDFPTEIRTMERHPNGIMAATTSRPYHSTDFGITWVRAYSSNQPPPPARDYVLTDYTVYVATFGGGVYKATSTNFSWFDSDSGIPTNFVLSLARIGNRLIAGTDGYGVYISDDEGQTWSASNNGLPQPITIQQLETDGTNLYAGSGLANGNPNTATGMYVSSDLGNSWSQVGNGLPTSEEILSIKSFGASLLVSSGDIYLSTDGGLSWSVKMDGIDTSCVDQVLGFAVTEDYVFCGIEGDCGGSIYRMNKNNLVSVNAPALATASVSVYPNPVQNQGVVNISNPLQEQFNLQLIDAQGRVVQTERILPKQSLQLKVDGLAKGFYCLRLRGKSAPISKSLVIY